MDYEVKSLSSRRDKGKGVSDGGAMRGETLKAKFSSWQRFRKSLNTSNPLLAQ
jgi:hypothetical protein